MSTNLERPGDIGTLPRSLMPPHLVLHNFLEEETISRLLTFTLAHEREFQPTTVRRLEHPNPTIRVSVATRKLGELRPILKSKILPLVPDWIAKLRATPVATAKLILELVAHNDGAFYRRHIDTETASELYSIRILSAVYYFHAAPRAFTGGALRLFAIGGDGNRFVDIEPTHNSLLVFPSWAPHEVMPVSVPSGRFADSRFAINCWIHREKAGSA